MGYVRKSPEAMAERRRELLECRVHPGKGDELLRVMKRFLALLKQE